MQSALGNTGQGRRPTDPRAGLLVAVFTLFERHREDRQTEILAPPQNANDGRGWFRLKLGAGNAFQVSNMGSRNLTNLAITYCPPETTIIGIKT